MLTFSRLGKVLKIENPDHLRLLYPIKEALGREHFLWDALTEESMMRERLKDYRAGIVPDGIVLEDRIRETLQAHTAAGGTVLWLKEVPATIAEVIEKQARRPLTWTSPHTLACAPTLTGEPTDARRA